MGKKMKKKILLALLPLISAMAKPAEKKPVETKPAETAPANRFRARRDRLVKMTLEQEKGNALILLLGKSEHGESYDPFRPNANFYYLTGDDTPGGALLLVAKAKPPQGPRDRRDMLFFPACDKSQMQWTGYFPCAGEPDEKDAQDPAARTRRETGAEAVLESDSLDSTLVTIARAQKAQALYVVTEGSALDEPLGPTEDLVNRFRQRLPAVAVRDLNPLLTEMRLVKDAGEIADIRKACAITTAAHQRVAKELKPGLYEYQLQAYLEFEYKFRGATGLAFPSIVGSGSNGTTLHYEKNERQMQPGELVVVDIGSEVNHYASDLTRTYPVSGKFSPRQKQIYTWVYEAQAEAFKMARPDSSLDAMNKAAKDYLKTKVCGPNGKTCDQYFIHGVGHTVGLEVHDTGHSQTLKPGFVITNEPGIYIPDDPETHLPIGVRIEDTLLITETGYETLSPPYHTADEVEAAMTGTK